MAAAGKGGRTVTSSSTSSYVTGCPLASQSRAMSCGSGGQVRRVGGWVGVSQPETQGARARSQTQEGGERPLAACVCMSGREGRSP